MRYENVSMYSVDLERLKEIEERGKVVFNGVDEFIDWNGEIVVEKCVEGIKVYLIEESFDDRFDVIEVELGKC